MPCLASALPPSAQISKHRIGHCKGSSLPVRNENNDVILDERLINMCPHHLSPPPAQPNSSLKDSAWRKTPCAALIVLLLSAGCSSVHNRTAESEEPETVELAENSAHEDLLSKPLEAQLQRLVTKEGYPAIVLAIVDGDSSQFYSFGALDTGDKPDETTLFEIGSLTKSFTSLLLADAVQTEQVDLQTPVQELLPDFVIPQGDSHPITLELLATHRSGLPAMPPNLKPQDPYNPYAGYDAQDLKDLLADYSLTREPGAAFEYSNLAFGLLGHALSQNAASTYEDLLASKIFDPLQMSSTQTFVQNASQELLARGHTQDGEPTTNWDFDALAPAGSIISNAQDLLNYLKAQMGILDSPLYQAMQITHHSRATGPPELGEIGLGWMISEQSDPPIIWHNGMTGGYTSFMGFLDDGSRGVLLLTNIAKSITTPGLAILVEGETQTDDQNIVDLSPDELDDLVGTYSLSENFIITIDREDTQLFAQATGQEAFPIYPRDIDHFFATIAPIEITFERDEAQQITGLILHQNGEHRARRLTQDEIDELEASQTEIELPLDVLQEYVGTYQLTPQHIFTVTLDDEQLLVGLTGQPAFPVFPNAKDHFFYKVVDAKIVFERDEEDRVTALILHQNGEQRAERIDN